MYARGVRFHCSTLGSSERGLSNHCFTVADSYHIKNRTSRGAEQNFRQPAYGRRKIGRFQANMWPNGSRRQRKNQA